METDVRRGKDSHDLLVQDVLDYAIFMLDPQGVVLTWNAGAERLKGYSATEIIGTSFKVFYPPEAVQSGWPDHELRVAAAEGRFEDEGWRVRKDGSRFWANVVITRLTGPDGVMRGFAKVTRDLTERRQHEEQLRRSEEQFRLLLESVKDHAIFMLATNGQVLTWNSGARTIFGWQAHEILGRHLSVLFMPEDVQAGVIDDELEAAARDGRADRQGWRVRKDASVFWAQTVISPVRDGDGRLHGFAKVTRDLSEPRRLIELEQASRRMSVFLAMLGHELRNPLAPIRNAVSVMQQLPELSPPLPQLRDILDRQVVQLTRLVDDLLDAGRVATGKIVLKRDTIDYRDVILMSIESARPLLEARRHSIEFDLPPLPILVSGDAVRLAQALQNLLNNAAKFMDEGGRIALTVRVDDRTCSTMVTDEGPGIDPELLERIFTLFFQQERAQSRDGGLGIGLSLSRALVEAHGGRLSASSAGPGHGSTFTLTLPLLDASALAESQPAALGEDHTVPLRVLVVDDNTDSADTMAQLLRVLHHRAEVAYGVQQGFEIARRWAPDVVLVDLNMPDGGGVALTRQLRTLPQTPPLIAAMTGYAQHVDQARSKADGFDVHISKPVGLQDLRRLLKSVDRNKKGSAG